MFKGFLSLGMGLILWPWLWAVVTGMKWGDLRGKG